LGLCSEFNSEGEVAAALHPKNWRELPSQADPLPEENEGDERREDRLKWVEHGDEYRPLATNA